MPHNTRHDDDFRNYANTRKQVLTRINEMRAFYASLGKVVMAMPKDPRDAGYMDLDNLQQLEGDLTEACMELDYDSLENEFMRLEL